MKKYSFAILVLISFALTQASAHACHNFCPSAQQKCSICCRDLGYDPGFSACRGSSCNCKGGNPKRSVSENGDSSVRVTAKAEFQMGLSGTLTLTQIGDGPVRIEGEIGDFAPNSIHGFHVHEHGDLSKQCASAGSHFNPGGHDHGGSEDAKRHVGDLGNIQADAKGRARIDLNDSIISLRGPHSIVDRAFVVHEKVDDLGKGGHPDSLTTGNAGARIGCALIGIL